MAVVIGVRFKEVGKIYYFDPDQKDYSLGELVIVETARGVECGTVAIANKDDSRPAGPSGRHSTEPPHADVERTGGAAATVHSPPPR